MLVRRASAGLAGMLALVVTPRWAPAQQPEADWPAYAGPHGTRYSPLAQITRANVARLSVAWTYRTGELGQGARDGRDLTFEATPILFEGTLYLSTAFGKVIALDPGTGRERWAYDAHVPRDRGYSEVTSRGVSAWRDPQAAPGSACAARILAGTIDARLIALDAATGAPCAGFGSRGTVNLATAVGMEGNGDYQVTSPPAVVNDVVVVGSTIGDNWNVDTGSGVVRGLDARTGEERWRWAPLPRDSAGFRAGAANAWSVMSADPERDLVFVPTTSPSPDFYGGERPGDNRYANSVVALRASSGALVWHFQTVHHDLWDYDIAAQPVLVTLVRNGRRIPAVVQPTKMGYLFILHRETGEPLVPVEERPVPASDVPGERAWPTQPAPAWPRPLVPHAALTPDDAWGATEEDRAACRALLEGRRSDGLYTPPSLRGTIMYPGNNGGINWGSIAVEPQRGLVVTNTSRLATLVQLVPRERLEAVRAEGGPYDFASQRGTPYGIRRRTLLSPHRTPCTAPPWGTLVALDLATGTVRWEIPFGTAPQEWGVAPDAAGRLVGWPSAGGPIVTAGGLAFIAASIDRRIRAYDLDNGSELWSAVLPLAGMATPMTYLHDGRQYLVIAAGGHGKWGLATGDHVIAFALPEP